MVGKETEEELTEESADGVSDLDTKVLVGSVGATLVVNVTNHGGGKRDTENVVGISEEAHAW